MSKKDPFPILYVVVFGASVGHYETVALTAGEYVKMSQVRGEINPSNDDLKASILRTGLINTIDVAHLSEASLDEYIGFVNQIWGAKAR